MDERTGLWSKFIGWIDRDVPSLGLWDQQLASIAPLCFTIFIAPGPGTPAMFVALAFYVVVTAIICWRLLVYAKKRGRVDRLIQRNMLKRFREGRWLPVVRRQK